MAKNKSPAFYEAGSWYHRIKVLQEDGTTKYSKKGGFTTAKDAEESYKSYEKQYQDAYRAYHIRSSRDFALKDYLIYWLGRMYFHKEWRVLRRCSVAMCCMICFYHRWYRM